MSDPLTDLIVTVAPNAVANLLLNSGGWASARVDFVARTVDVEIACHFRSSFQGGPGVDFGPLLDAIGGLSGGDTLSHLQRSAESFQVFRTLPPSALTLPPTKFARVKQLFLEGIGMYWSRPLAGAQYGGYQVRVRAVERDHHAIEVFLLKAFHIGSESGVGERPFNMSTFGDGLPIAFLYDEDVTPEEVTAGITPAMKLPWVEADTRCAGAHEVGHSILRVNRGIRYSLSHKGTSTYTQTAYPWSRYPRTGEVDVMRYYADEPYIRSRRFSAVLAATEDVAEFVVTLVPSPPPWRRPSDQHTLRAGESQLVYSGQGAPNIHVACTPGTGDLQFRLEQTYESRRTGVLRTVAVLPGQPREERLSPAPMGQAHYIEFYAREDTTCRIVVWP